MNSSPLEIISIQFAGDSGDDPAFLDLACRVVTGAARMSGIDNVVVVHVKN